MVSVRCSFPAEGKLSTLLTARQTARPDGGFRLQAVYSGAMVQSDHVA